MNRFMLFSAFVLALGFSSGARAEDYVLTIKDHRFSPTELVVPAGEKIKLKVKNLDNSPEEFESADLKREKVVGANGEITVLLGPLKPGSYKYVGEFHEDVAKGVIVAK